MVFYKGANAKPLIAARSLPCGAEQYYSDTYITDGVSGDSFKSTCKWTSTCPCETSGQRTSIGIGKVMADGSIDWVLTLETFMKEDTSCQR